VFTGHGQVKPIVSIVHRSDPTGGLPPRVFVCMTWAMAASGRNNNMQNSCIPKNLVNGTDGY